MMRILEFLGYIGSAIIVGGATAYGLFKLLAEKWLTAKFVEADVQSRLWNSVTAEKS
jgi:hypothetical protein